MTRGGDPPRSVERGSPRPHPLLARPQFVNGLALLHETQLVARYAFERARIALERCGLLAQTNVVGACRFVATVQLIARSPQVIQMRQAGAAVNLMRHVSEREREQERDRDPLEPAGSLFGHGGRSFIVSVAGPVSRKPPTGGQRNCPGHSSSG